MRLGPAEIRSEGEGVVAISIVVGSLHYLTMYYFTKNYQSQKEMMNAYISALKRNRIGSVEYIYPSAIDQIENALIFLEAYED